MSAMSSKKIFCAFLLTAFFVNTSIALAEENISSESSSSETLSPVGYWQTIDDGTHQPRSVIKICALGNKNLFGRIIQVNYAAGEEPKDLCQLCSDKDPRKNQKNLGMVILTDVHPDQTDSSVWNGGKVLDPTNGKIYNAKITQSDDGQHLTLRGYFGIELFGRSQTWNRISDSEIKTVLNFPVINKFDGYFETAGKKYVAMNYDSCDAMEASVKAMSN
jgi:hypothetical protein